MVATKARYSIKKDMDGVYNRNAIQCCDVNCILQALGIYFQDKKVKLNIVMCDGEKIAKYKYTSEGNGLLDVIIGWHEHWSNGIFITQDRMNGTLLPPSMESGALFEGYTWIICRRTPATLCHGINCEWVEISEQQAKALYKRYFPKL